MKNKLLRILLSLLIFIVPFVVLHLIKNPYTNLMPAEIDRQFYVYTLCTVIAILEIKKEL